MVGKQFGNLKAAGVKAVIALDVAQVYGLLLSVKISHIII